MRTCIYGQGMIRGMYTPWWARCFLRRHHRHIRTYVCTYIRTKCTYIVYTYRRRPYTHTGASNLLTLYMGASCILIAGTKRFCTTKRITLIPDYHRFAQTELLGFIFTTIVDNAIDRTIVNNSRENETKKVGLRKPVLILVFVWSFWPYKTVLFQRSMYTLYVGIWMPPICVHAIWVPPRMHICALHAYICISVPTYIYICMCCTYVRMYICTRSNGCIYVRGVYRYIYGEYVCIGVNAAGSLGFRV